MKTIFKNYSRFALPAFWGNQCFHKDGDEEGNIAVLEAVKSTISKNMQDIVDPLVIEQKELKKLQEEQSKKFEDINKKIDAVAEVNLNIQKRTLTDSKIAWKDDAGKALHRLLEGDIKGLSVNDKGMYDNKGVVLGDLAGNVPQEWIPDIFRIEADAGAFMRSMPRIVPIAEITNLAKAVLEPSVTWKSIGTGEGVETGDTKGTTAKVPMTRDRIIATIKLSNESLSYSNVALTNYFTELLREKVNVELDKQAFIANATPFIGVFKAPGVSQYQLGPGQTSFDSITWQDIRKIRRKVKSSVFGTCNWITSNTVAGLIEVIKDDNNRPIYDEITDKIMRHPLLITEVMPEEGASAPNTDFMIFGSARKGHVLGTGGFQVAASEHAEFKTDNIVLRVTMDVAMIIILGGAFVKVTTAAE